jgi:hypothetical protein
MASTKQAVATVQVFDYLYKAGDATATNPAPLTNAEVRCTLTYDRATSQSPVTNLAPITLTTTTDSNGYWSFNLVPNASINPANTTYTIQTPYSTYQIAVTASPSSQQSSSILVSQPITLAPGTTNLTGPLTVAGAFTGQSTGTFTGALSSSAEVSGLDLKTTGLTGATNGGRFVGYTDYGPPRSGTFSKNDWVHSNASGSTFVCTTAGTPGTWQNAGNEYNVFDWGAAGDGVTDDTAAIEAAYAAAIGARGTANSVAILRLPIGVYKYTGNGLVGTRYYIKGSGNGATTVSLGAGKYFMVPSAALNQVLVEDLTFSGGAGIMRHTFTGTNASVQGVLFRNCIFNGYTVCALGSLATDFPLFRSENNLYNGTSASSIGIGIVGDMSGGHSLGDSFQRNRYHIKLGQGGLGFKVLQPDFIRSDAYVSTPRVDVWLLPWSSTSNAGNGFAVIGGKYGNENLNANDFRNLYADEDTATGADFLQRSHKSTASTGSIRGHSFIGNKWSMAGSATPSFIYSTTIDVDKLILDNTYDGEPGGGPVWITSLNPITAMTAEIASSQRRVMVGNFTDFQMLQALGGAGFRFGLNNDGTFNVQRSPDGATWTTYLEIDASGNVIVKNGNQLLIGSFISEQFLQAAGGTGARWTLNNDGTIRLQTTTDGFATNNGTSIVMGPAAIGFYGHTPVVQPAAPVTLADVIAIIRGCGLSA